ncbi:hypothetical protein Vadar_017298 [Vaccinium darrowii]|uniref:Uncharacterized protein n=1 Tax=Vaccinium darrowii TaxID=229202 RepID=A0ACB7Z5B0_9ERIC|nr:hypothetical protein Vadar_017298 [Vaccinium darrowii]
MAGLSQFVSYLYFMTIICLTLFLTELVNQVCSVIIILYTSITSPIASARFLKLIDEENPASWYEIGKRLEPVKCTVCLSNLEKGDESRNLKCNHKFHKACVDMWLEQNSAVTCPLCRSSVLPEEIMVKLNQRRNSNQVYDGSEDETIFLFSSSHCGSLSRFL